MSIRKHDFVIGENYHVYNRGVDKRAIVLDPYDLERMLKTFTEFNTVDPIGSIYENRFIKNKKKLGSKASKLVDIIAYCINPNHFHLILTPVVEKGIEKLMQRVGGYTKYFNNRYKRSGSLFQDKFKSKYISDNRYLLHLSAYINMNNLNELGSKASKLSISSLGEYLHGENICNPKIILEQFRNVDEYKKFAFDSWKDVCLRKKSLKMLEDDDLEALLPS